MMLINVVVSGYLARWADVIESLISSDEIGASFVYLACATQYESIEFILLLIVSIPSKEGTGLHP